MPLRPFNREQAWLLPPTLGELIPDDHPARFIAEFVDGVDRESWIELGIGPDGEPLGAPSYHPKALLCVWLHGFMTGTRSSRKVEATRREQMSYLWLTGWQHPDHNTLWRFYQAHRQAMRRLLKYTVTTAVELNMIDLAVQAVDGSKIPTNAARARTYDSAGLQRLFQNTEAAIPEMEAQNESGDDAPLPRLPEELQRAQVLRQHVRDAMSRLDQDEGRARVNLTDEASQLMKGRGGIITGYNTQEMLSPLAAETAGESCVLITDANVVNTAADAGQLVSMAEQAEESTGERVPVTLSDGGYHTAANLAAGEHRGQTLVMGERYERAVKSPILRINSPTMRRRTATFAPTAVVFISVDFADPRAQIQDKFVFIVHRGQYAAHAPLLGFVPKMLMQDVRSRSALRYIIAQTPGVDENRQGTYSVCPASRIV